MEQAINWAGRREMAGWDVAAAKVGRHSSHGCPKSSQGSWSFSWLDPEPCGVKPVRCPLLCRYRRGSGLEPARHGAL